MTKLQLFEFWVRMFAWLGAWLLGTVTVHERISNGSFPLLTIIGLWIIVAAIYITGIIDIYQFRKKMKSNKPVN